MQTVIEKDVRLMTTPVSAPPVLATLVVLAVNPASIPGGTTPVAGRSTIWFGRTVPIDEEPTWEDAAWQ